MFGKILLFSVSCLIFSQACLSQEYEDSAAIGMFPHQLSNTLSTTIDCRTKVNELIEFFSNGSRSFSKVFNDTKTTFDEIVQRCVASESFVDCFKAQLPVIYGKFKTFRFEYKRTYSTFIGNLHRTEVLCNRENSSPLPEGYGDISDTYQIQNLVADLTSKAPLVKSNCQSDVEQLQETISKASKTVPIILESIKASSNTTVQRCGTAVNLKFHECFLRQLPLFWSKIALYIRRLSPIPTDIIAELEIVNLVCKTEAGN